MNTTQTSSSSGIGFAGLLTVLFIGLKLTGYIAWSWWWVLSPLWIGFAFALAVALFIVLLLPVIYVIFHSWTKTPTIKTNRFQERLKYMQKK